MPVWVDAFAPADKSTTWMTLTITAAPIGLLVGYGLSAFAVLVLDEWQPVFYMLIFSIVPLIFLIMRIENTSIDVKEHMRVRQ